MDPNRKKKPRGCSKKIINWEFVDNLLIAGCNGVQIAANLGIHPDTLYIRCEREKGVVFSAYLSEKRSKGNSMLLAKQFQMAYEGDKTMLVWLGKQRLDQSEKINQKIDSKQQISQKHILELPDNGRRKAESD